MNSQGKNNSNSKAEENCLPENGAVALNDELSRHLKPPMQIGGVFIEIILRMFR